MPLCNIDNTTIHKRTTNYAKQLKPNYHKIITKPIHNYHLNMLLYDHGTITRLFHVKHYHPSRVESECIMNKFDKTITKSMSELKIGDVVIMHGAKLNVIDVWNVKHGNIDVVRYQVSPYNDESIKLLSTRYANGIYGGNSNLSVTCYVKDGETT